MRELFLLALFVGYAYAQTPTGTIAGVVRDASGAALPDARIQAERLETGLARPAVSSQYGDYSLSALQAGEYRVEVGAPGFRTVASRVRVAAGETTTKNFTLGVGEWADAIDVEGATPQIRYDAYTVGRSVPRRLIETLPQNGRNFLDFAKTEPGVQPAIPGSGNRTFVPSLGAPGGANSGRATRITIDGGSIMAVGNGGSAMQISQETIQEFQIATANYDLSTGATVAGSINGVTRSGGNRFHGDAYWFFRDHHVAAYPALNRDSSNPNPSFQRKHFGVTVGGPIRRDYTFFFVNWERNEQHGAVSTTLTDPDFSHLSRITSSPSSGKQFTARVDSRLPGAGKVAHSAFLRYSHDGSRAFTPPFLFPNAYPSSWFQQTHWTDQALIGLTGAAPSLINEFRFSYFYSSAKQLPASERNCAGCLGIGAPTITVAQSGLMVGAFDTTMTDGRRFHLSDFVTWQHGSHRIQMGVDWEHNRGGRLVWANEPATIALYSPAQARQAGIQPPPEFRTLDDILALPLRTATVALGDPRVPQEDGGLVRNWDTAHVFIHDVWRLSSRLAANYGLSWSIDRNLNYDLRKPALLAPIFGESGLGPTRREWAEFSPAVGFAWMPFRDQRTVVRSGGGLFYDFEFQAGLNAERAALGPPGLGRQTFQGTSIPNPLAGIPDVPEGVALDFRRATAFTGLHLMNALPAIRAGLAQTVADADRSVQQIEIAKAFSGGGLNGSRVPRASAFHFTAGAQHELARGLVVSADFAFKRFDHFPLGAVDGNHFRSKRGPVIAACTLLERNDPEVHCSNGPINLVAPAGRASYRGLLVRVDRRYSDGLQFVGSWAYSRTRGTNPTGTSGFNQHNWLENRGPLATDFTHIFNLSGTTRLRARVDLAINFSYSSAPPFSAYVGAVDFNGDGTTNDLLPGSTVNAFNRGMDSDDLKRLVAQFNQAYAGTSDPQGAPVPEITLPGSFRFEDDFHALDLRASRRFPFNDRVSLTLIGEVFNVYNAANLSGFSGNLTNSATFGQPTSRSSQVFGSGGPRAFQFAVRAEF